jgi:hypothetical protein
VAQGVQADQVEGLERDLVGGQPGAATGMAASAACSRCDDGGGQRVGCGFAAGNTPLMTRYCFEQADGGQLGVGARGLAQRGGCCARATSTSRVRSGSARASTAALYWLRCFSSPASGPRHEASPLPSSRKPLQAPGNCSRRMVWPVGAVSNMMWS